MIITIKELLIPTLNALAAENSLTPEQYAANIVTSFLESQYRASILNKIKTEPVENLTALKTESIADLGNVKNIKPIK